MKKNNKNGWIMVLTLCMVFVMFPLADVKASILSSMQNATNMQYDTLYEGAFTNGDSEAWYTFTSNAGYYDYELVVTGYDLIVDVFDTDANNIGKCSVLGDSSYTLRFHVKPNSKNYVRIKPMFSSSSNSYYIVKVLAKEEQPDNQKDASAIQLNKLYNATVHEGKDIDWYKLNTGKYADLYKFNFSNPGTTYYVKAEIFDKNLNSIYSRGFDASSNDIVELELDKNSTYYIKFYTENGETSTTEIEYTFKVTKSPLKSLEEAPLIKSLESKNKGFKINIKKSAHATGYQIRYSLNSNMKSAKTIKTTSTTRTISKLKKDTIYYIQVRAYAKNSKGKIVYSKWAGIKYSKIGSVRTK